MNGRRVVSVLVGVLLLAGAVLLGGREEAGPAGSTGSERDTAGEPTSGPVAEAAVVPQPLVARLALRSIPIERPFVQAAAAPDPFVRAYARRQLAGLGLSLEGFSTNAGGARVALVSGRVLGVGDRVGAFEVSRVDEDAVTLVGPGGLRVRLVLTNGQGGTDGAGSTEGEGAGAPAEPGS